MKAYNPFLPLYSLHVPKCGGKSFRKILQTWFGEKLYDHYFHERNALPERRELGPGSCIHGHFNQKRGFGMRAYYPLADQFVTVLRDPLERALSNYFYWKRIQRSRMLDFGIITPGSRSDYRSLDDFIRKQFSCRILQYLPEEMTRDNYREYIQENFVWVGVADTLDKGIGTLAKRLGFPAIQVNHINRSHRDEELSASFREEYISHNRWAFEMVDFARSLEMNDEFIQF